MLDQIYDTLSHLPGNVYMLVVGGAIAATCSLLSPYVVLRKMALISEGVSHAGFGGISVALLMGYYFSALHNEFASYVITGLFCLGAALLIGFFSRSRRVHEDSAIGIVLVATVALGNVLLKYYVRLPRQTPVPNNIEQLLFGDFSAVNLGDVGRSVSAAVICFGIVGVLYWQFLYTTLDEEMAHVNGVNTKLVNLLMLTMISLVIVVGVRMVGFLMITAMMIIPGATASMMSRRFSRVLGLSIVVGLVGTLGAILLVAHSGLREYSSGPIIVLALFGVFAMTWVVRHCYKTKIEELATKDEHGH